LVRGCSATIILSNLKKAVGEAVTDNSDKTTRGRSFVLNVGVFGT